MNFPSLRLALVAGLALPLGFGPLALAQDAPPPPPPAAGMHHHEDPAARRAMMAEHLTAVLQLEPGQQAALNTFLDSMKPPEGMEDHAPGEHGMGEHLTTPERLDRMGRHLDEMRARFEAHAAAVKAFYAQLSPSQQRAFDALAPMLMMRHLGHDHGGWGGHRGGMEGRHGPDGDGHGMGPDGPPHG
jgi:hypothetical protein